MSKKHFAAKLKRQLLFDRIFHKVTWFFTFVVFALLAALIGSLIIGSMPAIKTFGSDFLFSADWNPVTEKFGALVPIVGTLITSIIALSIGIPVSFGIALFLTELSPPWLRRPLGTAMAALRRAFELLTPREREVLRHVVQGRLNKQIAAALGIHERTVKLHRTAITAKLKVQSVAELTRLCLEAGEM